MRIFLIRHGRQSDARCNVDVGLSREGERQADLVGRRLAEWGIASLVSSDMVRARETADIINTHLHLPRITVIPELRELDFGDMEGLMDEQIQQLFDDFSQRQARMDRDLRYPGGESVSSVLERALDALEKIAGQGHQRIAVVTHGVVIRALAVHAVQAPLPRWRALAPSLENSSITELGFDEQDRTFSLRRLNDHAHLEPHPELLREAWGVREN